MLGHRESTAIRLAEGPDVASEGRGVALGLGFGGVVAVGVSRGVGVGVGRGVAVGSSIGSEEAGAGVADDAAAGELASGVVASLGALLDATELGAALSLAAAIDSPGDDVAAPATDRLSPPFATTNAKATVVDATRISQPARIARGTVRPFVIASLRPQRTAPRRCRAQSAAARLRPSRLPDGTARWAAQGRDHPVRPDTTEEVHGASAAGGRA